MFYRTFSSIAVFASIAWSPLLLCASDRHEFSTLDGEALKGELIGVYNGLVFIDEGRGKTSFVPFQNLQEDSKEPVKQWFQLYLEEMARGPRNVSESDSKIASFLADKLQVWDEGELVDYEFSSKPEPEFYAFYYSAHWCGPCRRFTPSLRAFYNGMKAIGYDNFEIIFVSSDTSNAMMKKYMEEDKMPWPAVKYSKRSNSIISKYKGSGIPCLVVTDKNGNLLAHSYSGGEYLGPEVPKDYLESLLKYTSSVERKLAATDDG